MLLSKVSSVLLFCSLWCLFHALSASAIKQPYVVYLGSHNHGPEASEADFHAATDSHYEFLASFLGSDEKARDSLINSYQRNINGFSALLDEEEAAEIAKNPKVVSVFVSQAKKLHTSHSWEFMMQEKNDIVKADSLWEKADFGKDVIIANLDTGVWPELKSFSEEGYGPVPARWKGLCEKGVSCNKKLIGGKHFSKGYMAAFGAGALNSSINNPRDYEGHGTHTLSTAGGDFVHGATVFGLVNLTLKGGSPKSRVASYKVCWVGGCYDSDMVEAFDHAIHDGVDVISMSVGGLPSDYLSDSIAIGSFHAVKKGIVVVCSAGNDGPFPGSVSNLAPWIITVGASTLDRNFESFVYLGDGRRLLGASVSEGTPKNKLLPLISGSMAKAANASSVDAEQCKQGSLDPMKAKGKIVACKIVDYVRLYKSVYAAEAGAVGMILYNDIIAGNATYVDPHVLPATHINYTDGLALLSYINNSSNPTGSISAPNQVFGVEPAPYVAGFSSIGPNTITPEILKPDITAPGEYILAGYTGAISPSRIDYDKRRVPYTIMSGTSMACPHVAGVVGLLRKLHPDWSPAAIRSAISTSARTRDNTMHPMLIGYTLEKSTPLGHGSGHIRPNRAMDPGLVYDLTESDYLDFLCAQGYNETSIKALNNDSYKCPKSASFLDFNYPSITIPKLSGTVTTTRKLKNVGSPGKYQVIIKAPYGIWVSVEPSALVFENVGEEKSFKVSFKAKWDGAAKDYAFGGLTWTDGSHYVRSPIVVRAA
ncbi:subtilisin-like protease SBT5.4 [Mercurialis annua]|uniref:subtilisin-like protease SBT5.4 n=1 Tax=Mercurialis annua TaxID=3986 RepID=UPI00215F730C|nr:subtilisin-like protease SBT5.4 [Mercurialis annua]